MARRDYKEFAIREIHHAFNRGNDKMDIFRDDEDYRFFLHRLGEALYPSSEARGKKGCHVRKALPADSFSLIAFCLMPNHFHLLILQNTDLPISALMLKILTSYSKYFNKKYGRVGSLFQDQYKTTRIQDNTQLLHTSAYIHNNPLIGKLTSISDTYPYSSFHEYMAGGVTLSQPNSVLEQFDGAEAYRDFVAESIEVTQRNKE
jgi:putative transposase